MDPPPSTFWSQERSMKSCSVEKKVSRPQKEQGVNCPRCSSTNTKFCYYNNYSRSQPRYFCKTCRRYWTEGGSLRNIPVGGGSRKIKKPSSSANATSSSSTKNPDLLTHHQNPKPFEPHDLSLGFSTQNLHVPRIDLLQKELPSSSSSAMIGSASSSTHYSFVPFPFIACGDPGVVYTSGFPSLPEFIKPTLNFSLDGGLGSNYGSFQGVQQTNMKQIVFPFEDVKQVSGSGEQNGDSNGIWNGVLGGGSW